MRKVYDLSFVGHAGGIQQLVLKLKADRSYERLSKDCGGIPTSRGMQKLVSHGFTRFPSTETITGLAKGLGIPAIDVVVACAATLGIPTASSSSEDLLIAGAGRLPQPTQDSLRALATNILSVHEQSLIATSRAERAIQELEEVRRQPSSS